MPISKTLARMPASCVTSRFGSSVASVSRRFVCTQRMGSCIHQPCSARARWLPLPNTIATQINHDFMTILSERTRCHLNTSEEQ